MYRKPKPIVERLWDHALVSPTGCWERTSSFTHGGYGQLQTTEEDGSHSHRYAHRLAYEQSTSYAASAPAH